MASTSIVDVDFTGSPPSLPESQAECSILTHIRDSVDRLIERTKVKVMSGAGGVLRARRMNDEGAKPSVAKDKHALVLVPSSERVVGKPRCHYLEEEHSNSEWLDGEDGEGCEDYTAPSTAHTIRGDERGDPGSALKKKKKRMFRRRLQWRAPGTKPPSKKGATSINSPKKNNKNAPPLPPSNSARRRAASSTGKINVPFGRSSSMSVSFGRSSSFAGSFRSNASSYLTTKSSSTQKCSNRIATVRTAPKVAQASEGASAASSYSQASVNSSTPPLARYRWKRRLDASNKAAQMGKVPEANEENDDRNEDERTHVTIDKCRIRVCTNEQADRDELMVSPRAQQRL
ncbi:hypothetical protein THAOC_07336 [Thalassiosira oceanica]|uniref:Uncharacterized protein n=1 Tax=Thalassiosira oceanica TaxID=159749 RepID=K0T0M2_THAOC|nr:hypothetical protein THAOC_07336 [Thalassiosira oceanica]|eukprot:EJK71245.1 hypothetical protein THAOC_07336 [Thalassiosira oceanica]